MYQAVTKAVPSPAEWTRLSRQVSLVLLDGPSCQRQNSCPSTLSPSRQLSLLLLDKQSCQSQYSCPSTLSLSRQLSFLLLDGPSSQDCCPSSVLLPNCRERTDRLRSDSSWTGSHTRKKVMVKSC
jgi:hypothetical protein